MDERLLSDIVSNLRPSKTIAMFNKAKTLENTGKRILHLELGEPDIPSPKSVKNALIQALEENFTQYTMSSGIIELRKAIASYYQRKYNISHIDPNSEIVALPGAKVGIFNAFMSLINPGDEVIIPTPAWPSYIGIAKLFGGKPILIPGGLDPEGYDIDLFEKAINEKTKLIVLNFPSNPTSRDLGGNLYKPLAEIVRKNPHVMVLSDEIYSELAYNGTAPSFLQCNDIKNQSIILNGFSKSHSMTGYRLGYLVAPKPLATKISQIQGQSTTCPASFVQKAGIAALNDENHVEYARKIYKDRSKMVLDLLKEIPQISASTPDAGFYVFPKIEGASDDFAMNLLEKQGVAVTAGSAFKAPDDSYLRLSFATGEEIIKEGIEKMKKQIKTL